MNEPLHDNIGTSAMNFRTSDLCDSHAGVVRVLEPKLRSFGGRRTCDGPIRTLRVFGDNAIVRATLSTTSNGHVLVVDGGGSLRCALVGDQLAQLAIDHGWAGVVVWGCIRDSVPVATMPLAVFALATHPLRSARLGTGVRAIPVTIAGVAVNPGEYLYADDDGILIAPRRIEA